jgi:hypothetical protein
VTPKQLVHLPPSITAQFLIISSFSGAPYPKLNQKIEKKSESAATNQLMKNMDQKNQRVEPQLMKIMDQRQQKSSTLVVGDC